MPAAAIAQVQSSKTIEDLYPGLASDVLVRAVPAKLPAGVLLTAGELIIKEAELTRAIQSAEPGVRKQLARNAFFLLENMAARGMLLKEAQKALGKKGDDQQTVSEFLSRKIPAATPTEEEIKTFYQQNKEAFGAAPLEQVRGMIKEYLTQQKRQEAVQHFILTLGERTPIRINEVWLRKQASLSLDNPVDKARRSGKPTLVEFGATGCVPCDMMAPILEDLKKKFSGKLNILFVHVGREQVLGARFGIRGIPVQVFFDKNGKEVFRHVGFFPQSDLEKKLKDLGWTS